MRLVHLADLHLGYRQFDRVTPTGQNQREADVAGSFHTLIDRVIAIAPDVIVIGGDVFHVARPSNGTIISAFAEFSRLVAALPRTPVIIAAGNHDLAKQKDTISIVQLLAPLGIHVAEHESRRLSFPELDLSVLAVPDSPFAQRPTLTPDADAKYSVLLLHGEVQGMGLHGDRAGVEIPTEDIKPATWDYIALGHWHVYRTMGPNMFYSGSIDYTSSNPWGELDDERKAGLPGKGFIERNLDTGAHQFHALPRSRRHVDLSLGAEGMTTEQLDASLAGMLDASEIDDAIVRVVVTDVTRDVFRAVNRRKIREFQRRALSVNVVFRRPEVIRINDGTGRAQSQQPLDATVRDFITDTHKNADSRDDVLALAQQYLDAAAAVDAPASPTVEAQPDAEAKEAA